MGKMIRPSNFGTFQVKACHIFRVSSEILRIRTTFPFDTVFWELNTDSLASAFAILSLILCIFTSSGLSGAPKCVNKLPLNPHEKQCIIPVTLSTRKLGFVSSCSGFRHDMIASCPLTVNGYVALL